MLLSVVILSYNRPDQVKRILENLQSVASTEFNVIVKDDCSPRQAEIKEIVDKYAKISKYELVFYKNLSNLGYDRNLLSAFHVTDADYIFLLSDDDFIYGDNLPDLIKILLKREHKVYYTPYRDKNRLFRYQIRPFNLERFHEVIYNSILFSGLIFHRKTVLSIPKDKKFLSTCIYTQVYLAAVIVFHEKGFGEAPSNILHLGGDGENFFGKNPSAINQNALQNRSLITSNLKYQILLTSVVAKISEATDPSISITFWREYGRRMISYLLRARESGLPSLSYLINGIKESGVKFPWYIMPASYVLALVPAFIAGAVNQYLIKVFRKAG